MNDYDEFAQCLTSSVCKNAVKQSRDDKVCEKVGLKPQTLKNYKYQKRTMKLSAFIKLLVTCSDRATLNLIAEKINCIVYELPNTETLQDIELLKRTNEVMHDSARTVDSVVKSMEDGKYDDKEKQETKKIIRETLEALIALDTAINRI